MAPRTSIGVVLAAAGVMLATSACQVAVPVATVNGQAVSRGELDQVLAGYRMVAAMPAQNEAVTAAEQGQDNALYELDATIVCVRINPSNGASPVDPAQYDGVAAGSSYDVSSAACATGAIIDAAVLDGLVAARRLHTDLKETATGLKGLLDAAGAGASFYDRLPAAFRNLAEHLVADESALDQAAAGGITGHTPAQVADGDPGWFSSTCVEYFAVSDGGSAFADAAQLDHHVPVPRVSGNDPAFVRQYGVQHSCVVPLAAIANGSVSPEVLDEAVHTATGAAAAFSTQSPGQDGAPLWYVVDVASRARPSFPASLTSALSQVKVFLARDAATSEMERAVAAADVSVNPQIGSWDPQDIHDPICVRLPAGLAPARGAGATRDGLPLPPACPTG